MLTFPNTPFLNEKFSQRSGGIDFLGMRWVNLRMLGVNLLPGVSNATSDVGTYLLGVWIPWKFLELSKNNKNQFKLSNYKKYREAIEVAISHASRDESPSANKYGKPINRIGNLQKIKLPAKLTFANAKRSQDTTIYGAPQYGPSMKYLGLLHSGSALAEDQRPTGIPLAAVDDETVNALILFVDGCLRKSTSYKHIDTLDVATLDEKIIDDLGMNGLCPAHFRRSSEKIRKAFISKLLPDSDVSSDYRRTLTAKLIVQTLNVTGPLTVAELRDGWYTRLFDKKKFHFDNPAINNHLELWSLFQGRQYHRFIIELFLACFEDGLNESRNNVNDIVEYQIALWKESGHSFPSSFGELVNNEMQCLKNIEGGNYPEASKKWNRIVGTDHANFDYISDEDIEIPCARAMTMLARWWLRTLTWADDYKNKKMLDLGGADRLSMKWQAEWIRARLKYKTRDFLRDMFTELIFAQHMKIALSRFDGEIQRLRFILGDTGIIPTPTVADLGKLPGFMNDRLGSFTSLLKDLTILKETESQLDVGNKDLI